MMTSYGDANLHGNSVIVGRGGNFLLPRGAGLRVLVTAPAKQRARRYGKEKGIGFRQAVKDIAGLDDKRE